MNARIWNSYQNFGCSKMLCAGIRQNKLAEAQERSGPLKIEKKARKGDQFWMASHVVI